ncbi:MAG: shikimate dehydrogenase, partial [Planctomycetes bacterium]|nr:shikimate dehydrogenase [Planctomycetota bacterium]
MGGANDYSARLRMEILIEAVKAGADFIDCEYANFGLGETQLKQVLSQNSKTGLILSTHDFQKKFANIKQIYRDISQCCPAAIPKIVYQANHINDCFEAFDLLNSQKTDMIVLCMGQAGIISRIIAKKLGSFVTFASLDNDAATAPGQLTISQLKQLYRYDAVNADTELLGIIADPVGHSISPLVHNSCLARAGVNKIYLPLLVGGRTEDFNKFLDNIRDRKWLGFSGFSVTIPHKTNALEYLCKHEEYVEPLAVKIGAVNTITIGDNRRISGYNTDYAGAMSALTSAMGIEKKQLRGIAVAVVGAGGVARAIVAGLTETGAKVIIYNRTVAKAERLAEEFNCKSAPLDAMDSRRTEVIINCTSLGMYPDVDITPVPREILRPSTVVFDTVYNPIETLLLAQAKEAGAKIVNGAEMFLAQAMAQFKLFTGTEADEEYMRTIIFDY